MAFIDATTVRGRALQSGRSISSRVDQWTGVFWDDHLVDCTCYRPWRRWINRISEFVLWRSSDGIRIGERTVCEDRLSDGRCRGSQPQSSRCWNSLLDHLRVGSRLAVMGRLSVELSGREPMA